MTGAAARFLQGLARYGTGCARANQLGFRALGLVYFIAFASCAAQMDGLVGANGILPFADWLRAIRPQVAQAGYHHVPTLLWLWPSDTALHACLWAGMLVAVLLVAGFAPPLTAFLLWLFYLSATVAGQIFWSYQWDSLLLESGLLAVVAAPWRWRMRWRAPDEPPRIAVFLFHALVFKLMFLSGWAKLASGDPAWRNLTALVYHYGTQPLPIWTSWYAAQLPVWVQRFCCFVMFGIELALPFAIWLGRRWRATAASGFVLLMALVAATGNFAFFNLLTAVLCIWLVPDASWNAAAGFLLRIMPSAIRARISPASPAPRAATRSARVFAGAIGTALALGTALVFTGALRAPVPWPAAAVRWKDAIAPLRSVNDYGLFAVMTTSRPELIIEGSWDGERWFEYEFRWKPGDTSVRPRLVAPHQPRLDWQLWFAALGEPRGHPWLQNLAYRLMQNEPAVLDLLAYNPFEQTAPRYVRVARYQYRFASRREREEEFRWWTRAYKGLYLPPTEMRRSP